MLYWAGLLGAGVAMLLAAWWGRRASRRHRRIRGWSFVERPRPDALTGVQVARLERAWSREHGHD